MEKMDKLLIFPGPEVFWKKAILIKNIYIRNYVRKKSFRDKFCNKVSRQKISTAVFSRKFSKKTKNYSVKPLSAAAIKFPEIDINAKVQGKFPKNI